MQNAPAMLAQKMMNRQAAYAPVGMVSQNMSGNKKGGASGPSGPVIGLKFDTTTATAGLTFSDSDTTVTNTTGGNIASAKGNATTTIGGTSAWYWEFVIGSTNSMYVGVGPSSFVCNTINRVGIVANSISYFPTTGSVYANSGVIFTVATSTTGDVIGFQLSLTASSSTLSIYKNGTIIVNSYVSTTHIPSSATAWVPIWSANQTNAAATISNNIYSYVGYTPIGTSVTIIGASASVPAVADGAYDVYTFNASGTFTAGSTGAVRALVIAGGGGGAGSTGAGSGAGGYQEKGVTTTPQTYTITVGAGSSSDVGSNSSIGAALVSSGGGSGAPSGTKPGGSGGGAYADSANNIAAGSGISGQGFSGGAATWASGAIAYANGGGGGAGGNGGSANSSSNGGTGGAGVTSSITGTAVARGGGAAGNSYDGTTLYRGTATSGGGFSLNGAGGAGTANTGGGGCGNNGGSGVVIIRVRARA